MRWLVVVLLLVARPALGHPLDVGFLRVETTATTVTVELDLASSAAARLIGEAALDPATYERHADELATATYQAMPIQSDAGACAWGRGTLELRDTTLRQRASATCPAGARALRWELPFVPKLVATFQLLVRAHVFGDEHVVVVDRHAPVLELGPEGESDAGFGDFVWSGIEHIGAAPGQWRDDDGGLELADGIDHILFLLALLLAGGTLLQLVGIATGFTVGHSVTLALAALGILRIPPSIIEPLVALTIALAALEAFLGKYQQHRWKIAMGFGLIHGFAFAFALTELELSTGRMALALFGYNLGVEVGQVAIVVLAAPLVMLAHRDPRVRDYVVKGAASLIFLAGMYWFFERVLG